MSNPRHMTRKLYTQSYKAPKCFEYGDGQSCMIEKLDMKSESFRPKVMDTKMFGFWTMGN